MKKKILVVENDKDIREILTVILEEEGYETKIYSSYSKIFERIQAFEPDAILLDVIRPTEEGAKVCKEIKEAESIRHIPVIVLSTHSQPEVIEDICADKVVPKPFDIDFLLKAIDERLNSGFVSS